VPASKGTSGGAAGGSGLRLLAVIMGVFFLFNGLDKLPWFMDSTILRDRLDGWAASAHPASRWYLENIARPGIPLFARVVPAAEIMVGVAMVAGFWIRLAALVALLMVANFHVARGLFFSTDMLTDGVGLPVIGALLALSIAGSRLPFTLAR
jgi:uncharacterized membrane protein YphA (DoxX/SURF4 family)